MDTKKANFPGEGRQDAVGFSIGNNGYIGIGRAFIDNSGYAVHYQDFWEYNPVSNTWEQKTDFDGEARHGAVGFSIGNKGYIGTGIIPNVADSPKDFWELTP